MSQRSSNSEWVHRDIKKQFGVEKYLELNIGKYEKSLLSQLRYGVLPLRVETGRFANESRETRVCNLCHMNCIEDQYHFMFHCPLYDTYRNELLVKARNIINDWDNLSYGDKLSTLFIALPRSLGKYVKNSFVARQRTIFK